MKKPILREEPAKWRGKSRPNAKSSHASKARARPAAIEDLGFSTITAKGQTTIPKKVRDRMGLRPGSRLDFYMGPDGIVRLHGASLSIHDLFGILGKPKRRVTIEEMNEVIRRRWAGLR